MKYLLGLVLFFIIGVLAGFAQTTPLPPPPPLIYQTPAPGDLKEFVSEDKTFQITFPCVPKIANGQDAAAAVTTIRCYRQGSNSLVNISEFNFEVDNQKGTIFEFVKTQLLKAPKSKIENERDIQIGDKPAKEFDVLQDYNFQKIRILVDGKRVYEIKSDVTNWHILRDSTKKEFFTETTRFFDSFKLLGDSSINLSEPINNFLGKVVDTTYINEFFNFSIEYPEGWYVLSETEIEFAKKLGAETFNSKDERTKNAINEASKNEVVLFSVAQNPPGYSPNANLGIGALKQPNNYVKSELVANLTKDFFLKLPNTKILQETQNVKLKGVNFSTFSTQINNRNSLVFQKFFITIQKGYSLTFVITYIDDKSRRSLEKIFESLEFRK